MLLFYRIHLDFSNSSQIIPTILTLCLFFLNVIIIIIFILFRNINLYIIFKKTITHKSIPTICFHINRLIWFVRVGLNVRSTYIICLHINHINRLIWFVRIGIILFRNINIYIIFKKTITHKPHKPTYMVCKNRNYFISKH